MTDTMECHLMCRLCLVKEQVNIPIFEEQGNLHTLQKITTCLPLKVTREDRLPKSICDGCNFKLDQQYQFWNTSVNAEKQLKSWLGIVDDPPPKVKKEKEVEEVPVSKRPRRNARRKAAANARKMAAIPSDSDDDNRDFDSGHTVAKEEAASDVEYNENDSLEPTTFVNVSLQDPEQAGPSGVQKSGGGSSSAPATATSNTEAGNFVLKTEMKEENTWADDVWMGHVLEPECEIKKSGKKRNLSDKEKTRERRKKTTVHSKPVLRFKLKALVPTSDGKYKCKICGESFASAKRYHYLKHEKTRPFSCDVCGKTFHLSWHLNSHKKSHDNTELFKCEVCNKAVKNLKQHRILHMNVFPFRCEPCEKNFRFRSELKIHNESCHSDVKHTCSTCGKTYLLRHSLREHEKVAHNPFYIVKMFDCEVCGQSVPKRNRARHMERHIGYTCDICGKCVTTKKSLDLHLLRHRGEKPLSCDVCGNNFVNLYTLTCHKRIHEGVKPYKCTECGKCFRQSGSLKIHARLHTGERPYSCQFCSDAFVSRTLLNTHVKNRHGVRD